MDVDGCVGGWIPLLTTPQKAAHLFNSPPPPLLLSGATEQASPQVSVVISPVSSGTPPAKVDSKVRWRVGGGDVSWHHGVVCCS